VVALLWRVGLVDRVVVVHEIRIPLVRLAPEKAVEALEAAPEGPAALPGRQVRLLRGREVPFADGVGVPAPLAQHLRGEAVLERDAAEKPGKPAAPSVMQAMPLLVALRPLSRLERVGEQSAVV
jgi:hypothetical protein